MRVAVLAAVILGLFPIVASAAPVAPEDLFKMTFLNSALISPDGTQVLVESSRMKRAERYVRSHDRSRRPRDRNADA